jgi:hypothetical protein
MPSPLKTVEIEIQNGELLLLLFGTNYPDKSFSSLAPGLPMVDSKKPL